MQGGTVRDGWALQRTVKFLKAIVLCGDDVYADDLKMVRSMEEALMRKAVGSYFNLVTETESKAKLITNYDIRRDELQPVNPEGVSIDGLPF